MPVPTGVTLGFEGSVGIARESTPGGAGTPGLFVAPTQFLLAESDTLDSVPAMIERNVIANSRDADRGHRTGKEKVAGQWTMGLYPDNGMLLPVLAIGKDTMQAAITPDTITSITTALGISTLVLTGGTGAYKLGSEVDIDTLAALERRQVLTWDVGTKTMTVAALRKTHTVPGVAITQVQQHHTQPFTWTDGVENLLGSASVQQNIGARFAYLYPYMQVDRWEIRATSAKVDVTADLVGSAPRVEATSFTAFDETDPSLNNLSYEFTDGFMVAPADQTNTGTSTLQRLDLGQDWTLTVNNNFKENSPFDGTEVLRHFPGRRQVTGSFKYLNTSGYAPAFKNILKKNINTPLFFQFELPGTTPYFLGIRIPNARYTLASPIHGLEDEVGEQINFTAIRSNNEPKIELFYTNGSTTAL